MLDGYVAKVFSTLISTSQFKFIMSEQVVHSWIYFGISICLANPQFGSRILATL